MKRETVTDRMSFIGCRPGRSSGMIRSVMDDPLQRRVAQLETTLMRRNEQLAEAQAALAAVQDSHAFKLAHLFSKVARRILPLHSRRRRALRGALRRALRFA